MFRIEFLLRGFVKCVGTPVSGSTDAELAANIDSMLLWNQYTDALDIDVASRNGVVTLTGVADTAGAKKRAEAIALGTMGIKAVISNLRVDGPRAAEPTAEVGDDLIKDEIANSYLSSAFTPGCPVSFNQGSGMSAAEVALVWT